MPDILDLLEAPGQEIIITPGCPDGTNERNFLQLCELYPYARIEMDKTGSIIMTPGNGEDSSFRSGQVLVQLSEWAPRDGSGLAFDASASFNLANGAKRSPDASWVSKEVQGENTHHASKTRHARPFVVEVMSPPTV